MSLLSQLRRLCSINAKARHYWGVTKMINKQDGLSKKRARTDNDDDITNRGTRTVGRSGAIILLHLVQSTSHLLKIPKSCHFSYLALKMTFLNTLFAPFLNPTARSEALPVSCRHEALL